ncbi:MAG: hypothetical protein IPJ34_18165 [Myxococcales bacterium]|nr:hypothetical protein [Myxococcales bacterium]
MSRGLRVLPVLATGVVLAVYCARTTGPATRRAVAVAPSESARPSLLEDLKAGDVLGEWTVERIQLERAPNDTPELAVDLQHKKGAGITVWVHRKENAPNPPLTTERYALTYGHARPGGPPPTQDDFARAMALVAERIRRTEATAPIPDGL